MKYELMRLSSLAWKRSICLDLYNYPAEKNIELHYSTYTQEYDKKKLDILCEQKRHARELLTLDEWDTIVESCRKKDE